MNTEGTRAAHGWWAWCVCLLLLWASPAHARSVAVLYAEHSASELTETLNRIRGELLAVGLGVHVLHSERGTSTQSAWLPSLEAQHFDAALVVMAETSPPVVDVWLFERASEPTHVARVSVEPDTNNAPEKLAIRAIDVLRSAFLENDMLQERRARERVAEPSAEPATHPERNASPHSPRLGLSAGIAGLTSLDAVGPELMPMARLDFTATSALALHAVVAGLGSGSFVQAGVQRAWVQRSYALMGARYSLAASEILRPFTALAVGAMSTSIEGRALPPADGHRQSVRSLLLCAGVGVDWQWLERYFTRLAADVQLANPSASVYIVDTAVGSTGRPDLALALTVGAWL